MGKLLLILFIAALLGCCHGDGEGEGGDSAPSCPTDLEGIFEWIFSLSGYCGRQMITALRLSLDNCEQETEAMEQCAWDEMTTCLTEVIPDILPFINSSRYDLNMSNIYTEVFCVQPPETLESGMEVYIQGCESQELTDATDACGDGFLAMFNADRLDDGLCDEYYAMTNCQAEEVQNYCSDTVDADILERGARARENMNLFCTDGEHGIGGDGGDGDDDDDDSNACVLAPSLFHFGLSLLFAGITCDLLA